MNFIKKPETRRFLSKLLLAILVISFYYIIMNLSDVITGFKTISKIFMPFFYGFIIAYLLNIPCSALEHNLEKAKFEWVRNKARGISVLIVYAIFIYLIVLTINKIIPALQRNISDFILNFSTYYNNIIISIKQLPIDDTEILDSIVTRLMNLIDWKLILEGLGIHDVLSSLTVVFGLTSYIINGFIAIITSIYFLLETKNFKNYVKRINALFFSKRTNKALLRYSSIINESFKKFIVCQLLDSLILGTITSIEFTLLGSKYAIALGVMLAICNIIPYFGSIFGSIVAVIIVASMNGLGTGVATAIVLLITQQLDGNVIQPKLMGNSFSLSPALIVIGISIGGSIAGIWGMILAIPIVNIVKQIIDDMVNAKEASLMKKVEEEK